jgi:hypothetical protein
VFLKKIILSTLLLALFFLAVPDRIKAQIASIISEDGDGIVGITSLMNATINGDIQAVSFFAKSGNAVVNQKNIGGASALHIAARKGDLEISKILIENGANVNATDNEGWTPLMRAVMAKNVDLIKVLMNHDADPRKMNSVGETAIVNSASVGCGSCLEQILSNYNFIDNLNIDILKKQLKDAMVIANNKNDLETQSIIKEYFNSELNKSQIYSLSNNYSPKEAPITPKAYNGDGIVKVKSLDDMSKPTYKFAPIQNSESSPKIPQKIDNKVYYISKPTALEPVQSTSKIIPTNKKFIFKGSKKPYTPLTESLPEIKAINKERAGVYNFKQGKEHNKTVHTLPKAADKVDDVAIPNDNRGADKKFIFKGATKPYDQKITKINTLDPEKKSKETNYKLKTDTKNSANTNKVFTYKPTTNKDQPLEKSSVDVDDGAGAKKYKLIDKKDLPAQDNKTSNEPNPAK